MMMYLARLLSFLVLGILVWTCCVGLWLSLLVGSASGFLSGLLSGSVVCFLIVFVGFCWDLLIRITVFFKYGYKGFNLEQIRIIDCVDEISNVFDRCINALRGLKRIGEINVNQHTNTIIATTLPSVNTFGEMITVQLSHDSNVTIIHIKSKPRRSLAVFDCGRNIENVELISAELLRGCD